MKSEALLLDVPKTFKQSITLAKEYRVLTLREMPDHEKLSMVETPDSVEKYYREFVMDDPRYNADVESFHVLILNTRRRCIGHVLVSTGTIDTLLVHPSAVYRAAVVANAAAIICVHNHPSGDATPSESDIKVTRDLVRAGQVMKVELLDHVIMGTPGKRKSLRELGYFYSL